MEGGERVGDVIYTEKKRWIGVEQKCPEEEGGKSKMRNKRRNRGGEGGSED